MAINYESLRTRPVHDAFEYLSMLRRLLPRGPIWGFDRRLVSEVLQDIIPPGDTLEDEIHIEGDPDFIQDTIESPEDISSSYLGRLLSVIAEELARLEVRAYNLLQESAAGVSVELLEDWEKEAGIGSSDLPTEERQKTVHAKIYGESETVSKEYLIDYAANLGFTITIDEATGEPSRVGVARVGANRVGGLSNPFTMVITVLSGTGDLDNLKSIFNVL